MTLGSTEKRLSSLVSQTMSGGKTSRLVAEMHPDQLKKYRDDIHDEHGIPHDCRIQRETDYQTMIDYLMLKIREKDWHAVSDAANDLREMEARNERSIKSL